MSPSTACGATASILSIMFWPSTVALTRYLPGTLNEITRPCTVALFAIAALTTP